MHPGIHAQSAPDRAALIMVGTGEVLTYGELDRRSIQLARLWQEAGLRPGDHVAIFSENQPRYFEVMWAALRSGLYVTTVNSYLSVEEVGYILDDSGARVLVTTTDKLETARRALDLAPRVELAMLIGGHDGRFESYEEVLAGVASAPLAEEPAGEMMLYSSGTTGRPKGIKRPLSGRTISEGLMTGSMLGGLFGMGTESVYLSPAPLYHAAPIGFTLGTQSVGGTVIVMERFDPVEALAAIERYRATHSQWVPTMFVRMLKLDEELRGRHDISSMQVAVHAAAPCPVEVKRRMMDWWGPVLWEYYAGTELNGFCLVGPEDWLEHPGTVGRPLIGQLHIVDDNGNELPAGQPGTVYFGEGPEYEYHNAPEKTESVKDPGGHGWTTLGDLGYVDEDGWLFLTDRQAFMIISGGVNIYPQEVEDCLVLHPSVTDVAVFGIPDPEMGEVVMAVVEPADGIVADDALAAELRNFTREHIAHFKCPTRVEFVDEIPRLPTGKLYKRVLRDPYWVGHEQAI